MENEDEKMKEQEVDKVEEQSAQDDFSAKIAEMQAQIEALKAERDTAKADLDKNKAEKAIEDAVKAGKFTPAQVAEGSVFVEIAHKDPATFARIVDLMEARKMPENQEVARNEEQAVASDVEQFKKMVAEGVDPFEAIGKVSK